ncbi:MAG: malto-oligosyltrehalose trehalohydrolase [Gammaproteobacteria bacterium]|nr:malto-oligosyltrehalose trehalohydrolase [Gammaproteobacteria bacterium]
MKSAHAMPFGTEIMDQGVRFAIWAPAAAQVELHIEGRGDRTMLAQEDGFHVCLATDAAAGDRYAFSFGDDPLRVPDPASRFNPIDVHGASEVVDPHAFDWNDDWAGRPWREPVFYELHIGAFTPQGTYAGIEDKLDHLAGLGVTAIELMPIAEGPGRHNWGYDGALPFAPKAAYGRPEDLKRLVQAAHRRGLMVFLDVVYNHFGPEGNYLPLFAPQFFTDRHETPWGKAINFDGPDSRQVRRFFTDNALYWLGEYHFDGLRLDAVHAIIDDSDPSFLRELAEAVQRLEDSSGRPRHLVLENGDNVARYLERERGARPPRSYVAQWNDDFHHCLHVLLTGESAGYYEDYDRPGERLLRCLTEGFAYQGEPSRHAGGRARGEPSAGLPPEAFVNFLQNHDQVGNRPYGDRLWMLADANAMRAAETLLLLLPTPILLFMGDEFHAPNCFPFFSDFGPELAQAVTEGRRREFAHFFANAADVERIPDPNDEATVEIARLDWAAAGRPDGAAVLERYRQQLALRRERLVPRLPASNPRGHMLADAALTVTWSLADGSELALTANLSDRPAPRGDAPRGEPLCSSGAADAPSGSPELPPWYAAWHLHPAAGGGRRPSSGPRGGRQPPGDREGAQRAGARGGRASSGPAPRPASEG